MSEPQSQLLAAAREFVADIFLNKVNKRFTYHNLEHTEGVASASEEMANHYQFQPEDREILLIAAWFHDTGFSSGESTGHEDVSINLVTAFLQDRKAEAGMIEKVVACIGATKMPQSPSTLIEQVLCDADLFHLGTAEFKTKNEKLRQELSALSKEDISKKKWRAMNIKFMENHQYFTDYCRRKLQPIKEEHIQELKGKDSKKNKNKKEEKILAPFTEEVRSVEIKKKKDSQTERGISTVFRIMAHNHSTLSQMADNKAHIMISVNSIILSVVVAVLSKHLDDHPSLVIPTITLIIVCVAAIIYSVLATRPTISQGIFTREDIQSKKTNLLFFGNFHKMNLTDYDWAMKEMLGDRDYLYGSMIKDIYFLGVVLAKKYRYLRISYSIFMYGLVVSMLAFGAVMAYDAFFVTTTVQTLPVGT